MSKIKYEKFFAEGNYEDCKKELITVAEEINNGRNILDLISSLRLDVAAQDMDPHIVSLMLEGNTVLVESLICITTTLFEGNALDCLFNYCKKIQILINNNPEVPLYLYLNSLHNSLWKTWIFECIDDSLKDQLLEVVIEAFKRVLFSCGIQAKYSTEENKKEVLHELLYQIINTLSSLNVIECLLLIEIILLCFHVFLNFKSLESEKLKSLVFLLNDSWDHIKKIMLVRSSQKVKKDTKFFKLFRLGLVQINETIVNDLNKVWDNFCILSSLALFRIGCLRESLEILNNNGMETKHFLWHYMQGIISLSSKELDVCLMHIEDLSRLPMDDDDKTCYHYLQGHYNSSVGQVLNAHENFISILPRSKKYFYTALVNILENVSKQIHSFVEKCENKMSGNVIIIKFVDALQFIFKYVCNSNMTANVQIHCVNEKIFSILHEGRVYQVNDVLHTIGKELLWIMVYKYVLDTSVFSNFVANCYMEILFKNYEQDPLHIFQSCPLPIIHETIVALLLDNKVDNAATICNLIAQEQIFMKDDFSEIEGKKLEKFLMEKGITASLLSAVLKVHQRQYQEALACLRRIKKNLLRFYFCVQGTCLSQESFLLDAVLAKIFVMNAALLLTVDHRVDAWKNCERALLHNPSPEIIEDCKYISEKIGTEVVNPPSRPHFSIKNCKCLVLSYFLFCETTIIK